MSAPIDFYFDFSSPYGYFASHRIDAIAERHGRAVNWRPYLMGAVMKITGARPIPERPLIAAYGRRDMERTARHLGVPWQMPEPFPVATVAACRAYYWVLDRDPARAKRLASVLYAAYFAEGHNIGEAEVVITLATAAGIERAALEAALQDPAVKQRLRVETDAAIARGVFGSPFFIVDGEPFWGNDRLAEVDEWLRAGGW